MQSIIRRGTLDDAAAIVEFNRGLAWETEQKTLDLTLLRRGVTALLDDPAKGFYTVAESNGELVGQTLITMEWSDWRNGWFWWIQSVYVKAEARSSGVFNQIYQHLLREAQSSEDVIGLRLYVERDNERAKAVYRKLGMTDTPYDMLEVYPLTASQ